MQLIQWFILTIISLVSIKADGNKDWTLEDAELLALHNAYRQRLRYGRLLGQPRAMEMPDLRWSFELANISKSWASTCQSYPSNITMRGRTLWTYVGQNVAVSTNVRDAVASWFNEYSNYDFQQNKCNENKKCANYKQVVFSQTLQVGCAHKKCDNFKAPYNIVVVCTYGPGE
uniref:SCP domain-containing protein n=1 Tax=Trichobilharzia regenti TaxID=157069 RepID=A0AA85J5B9_TRIRE|nr:unnamed protein product [Trichobilharzia regenti]